MVLIRKGNTLHGKGASYLITERKHTTPSKPRYYLLQKQPTDKYISSLYGEYPDYEMEYQGKRYKLKLTETEATISPIKKGVSNVF